MDFQLLWIIQSAPLLAFLFIQLLPKSLKRIAPVVGVVGTLAAALSSVRLLLGHLHGENLPLEFSYQWLEVGDHALFVGFLVDPLNILMITLVTSISFFVQLFSVYYMNEDEARARYFGFLSFFSFSMTGLVLSNNLLQTFLFWELVGLTSYLLIGFWYQKKSAATAARKAFVLNRLGDLGFYLGVIFLFIFSGTLNFLDLTGDFLRQTLSAPMLTLIGILVLTGVMGKSAQFPFHVWLPDAMEGPTPVSALIHSATMVAAGVFLLARAFALFSASQTTLLVVLTVGALTALVGACLATIQRDIKRILAYSTVSQLGLMVMAVGSGSAVAGMFHLSTHAYFKSLLFLTSGAFIHAFHTNDIWEIGQKGGKKEIIAMGALLLGLFSLCGIFPFSGFFSKDMILEVIKERSFFFYAVAIFVSFLTVYYSFRLLFVIALSKTHADPHASSHKPSALLKFCEATPLILLGAISVYVGALGTPLFGSQILHWLGGHATHLNLELLVTTSLLILVGAGLAYFQFRDPAKAEENLKNRKNVIHTILEKKFFMDDAYDFVVKSVGLKLAWVLDWFDRTVINGLMVNQTAYSILRLGRASSKLQTGLLQDYLSLAIGLGVLIVFIVINSNAIPFLR